MHGAGNDFIIIDGFHENLDDDALSAFSKHACKRGFGIGADGVIVVLPSKVANYRMRMLNPDGSEAEMCGNGIRCFAKYVYDRKMHKDVVLSVETLGGVKTLKINAAGGKAQTVRVDMGEPVLARNEIPMRGKDNETVKAEGLKAAGKKFEITCVSMGNPHCIIFVDKVDEYPVEKFGPEIETHASFPKRTNVEFVEVISNSEVRMRVWERGAGETLACGTGACATAVASALNDKTGRKVTVHLNGGDLFIEWMGDNKVFMTGPAVEVFEGEVPQPVMEEWLASE